MRYLLDTQIVVRWVAEPGRLSREHTRILRAAELNHEEVGVSALSLLEITALEEARIIRADTRRIFEFLQANPVFTIVPISFEVALEVPALKGLRDPADRAIVATARIHRLKLLTTDQKIIESGLVDVVE